jgi:hypothetical protein
MMTARNANAAAEAAESFDASVTQSWEDEATIYRFNDDSHLVISGPQINAYEDWEAVLSDFPHAND